MASVQGLMSEAEFDYFVGLTEDFRRDAFMEAFWEPRDPDRSTPRNELRERWSEYRDAAGNVPYGDPRFLLLLFNGPPGGWSLPDGRPVARCFSRLSELEIWFYEESERSDRRFPVIFLKRSSQTPYEAYRLGESLRAVQRSGGLPTTDIRLLCADELLRYTLAEMRRIPDYDGLLTEVLSPLLPSPEWLMSFSSSATDLPAGAETFEVGFELGFPARKQSRTAVQALLAVDRAAAPGRRFDGELYHNLLLVGEVIRDGQLFETFRYRFEGPTPEEVEAIPLGFTLFLRPGPAELRLRLEDVFGGRYARIARQIEIPSPEGLPPAPAALAAAEAEVEAPALELLVPPGDVHVGQVRFRARARTQLDKVSFFLDDQPVLSKRRPPYSVELDLGTVPEPHRVRVVGYVGEREVATDQIWLNQGARRFRVLLIEPRAGGIYPGSLTARAEVETPDDRPPETLELYLNDERVASFAEPPYEKGLRLPDGETAVVRAVARLADGSTAEDAVVVNASRFGEAVEVRLVELYPLVRGRDGEPLRGLERERFRVFDGGAPQTIERFEAASEVPIHAALMIDTSASMAPRLGLVAAAARDFARAALAAAEDRVALYTFADRLTQNAGWSGAVTGLERALAGLVADGGTALWDSLVQAFNGFDGVRGPAALVLFTDGRDEASRLGYEEVLESARRAGATLYVVALGAAFPEKAERRQLERLAAETGGVALFPAGVEELPALYATILEELRGRYLITYQPPAAAGDDFREVRVEVDVPGARVEARRGYYP